MTQASIAAIILAAGKGTRMNSATHKVLHPIGGQPMLAHLLATLDALGASKRVLVVGAGREQFEGRFNDLALAVQEPQLGTGHAVMAARDALGAHDGTVLILYGDVPLIEAATLASMADALAQGGDELALMVLGFRPADPAQYGRLIVGPKGKLEAIVEYKDATSSERAINLCNSGIMAVKGALLFELLDAVGNDNAAGEYYLTDIVAVAARRGLIARVVECPADEVQGVNSRAELAQAERAFQQRARTQAMARGVSLVAPETVFFSHDTVLGQDVLVEPHVVFGPGVTVADGVTIKAFSHVEGAAVAAGAVIGPYARLRPGADIGADAKIGNFVEVKAARIDAGAKVNHLTYIGDAHIGAGANIGAGTITCNYDGFLKYKTEIGAGAFIGSNSALVAPVKIGAGAIIGAGSVITKDVEADALAVARGKQQSQGGWAAKFKATMAARKASKTKGDS
ncbi:MAG: bifunctional UDP-N-acetylglucosamine diphosphorylase/glucosamine-1-phosphate N-acetyltransferase GlmU [Sphingomonadales bacterium]